MDHATGTIPLLRLWRQKVSTADLLDLQKIHFPISPFSTPSIKFQPKFGDAILVQRGKNRENRNHVGGTAHAYEPADLQGQEEGRRGWIQAAEEEGRCAQGETLEKSWRMMMCSDGG